MSLIALLTPLFLPGPTCFTVPQEVATPVAQETLAMASIPRVKRRGMRPHVADALRAARREVEAAPRAARAWGGFADLLHAHGMFEEAEACYREANNLDPRQFRYAYMLAVEGDLCGRDVEATVALFERALELRPDYLPAHVRKGHVLFRAGDWEASRASFQKALDAEPSYLAANLGMGQVLLSLDRVPQAIQHLERVHAEVPEDRTAATALARAYMRANERDKARTVARSSFGTEPLVHDEDRVREEVEALAISTYESLQRAQKAMEERRYADAVEALETYLTGRARSPGVRCELGRAHLLMGNVREARIELRRSLEGDPDHIDANVLLARTLVFGAGRKASGAGKLLQRALAEQPDLQEAIVLQASLDAIEGKHREAVEGFGHARLLARRPGVKEVYELQPRERFLFAASLLEQDSLEEARREFTVVLDAEPRNGAAHFGLAEVYAKTGQVEAALTHYRRAERLTPSLPVAERIRALETR